MIRVSVSWDDDLNGKTMPPHGISNNRFWCTVREKTRKAELKNFLDNQFELLLQQELGIQLRKNLIEHIIGYEWRTRRISDFDEKPETNSRYSRLFAKVVFSIRHEGYSSLLFGIDVSSIQAVAELFDYCYDAFEIFLEQHIPQSFERTFSVFEPAQYRIHIDRAVAKSFDGSKILAESSKNTDSTVRNRANWIWILSNTSLVVPSVFALFAAYAMVTSLDKKEERVLKLQQEAIEAERKSFSNIVSAYSELIKQHLVITDQIK